MRYGIANLTIVFGFVALLGATYEAENLQTSAEKTVTKADFHDNGEVQNQRNMSLKECQAIHDRIRKEKDDESLYKGAWLNLSNKANCPVLKKQDYQAMAKF